MSFAAHRRAGELLLDHVIGTAEPETTTPWDVNLIGEYNIAGDLWGVEPLLATEWKFPDPTTIEGSREQKLQAYREVCDGLSLRIRKRFSKVVVASG